MIILKGNLLETPFEIIAHQVNCQGRMNSGVAKQIRENFSGVFPRYTAVLIKQGADRMFGKSQIVYDQGVGRKHTIFNIFSQYRYGYDGAQYTSYEALESGFIEAICDYRQCDYRQFEKQITIAIPYKIGCDRGGGDWNTVKEILEQIERDYNVVFVAYKLEESI